MKSVFILLDLILVENVTVHVGGTHENVVKLEFSIGIMAEDTVAHGVGYEGLTREHTSKLIHVIH